MIIASWIEGYHQINIIVIAINVLPLGHFHEIYMIYLILQMRNGSSEKLITT